MGNGLNPMEPWPASDTLWFWTKNEAREKSNICQFASTKYSRGPELGSAPKDLTEDWMPQENCGVLPETEHKCLLPNYTWLNIIIYPYSTITQIFFRGATAQIRPTPPNFEFSRSYARTHAHAHTQTAELPWTNDQLVAEAGTYTTHNKHNRRTSTPSAGFEPATPAIKRPQAYALARTATGIGNDLNSFVILTKKHNKLSLWPVTLSRCVRFICVSFLSRINLFFLSSFVSSFP